MKTLRMLGTLALVWGLLLGVMGSAFAQDLAGVEGVIKAINSKAKTVTVAPKAVFL